MANTDLAELRSSTFLRRFRFSLRAFLAFVTIAALVLAVVAHEAYRHATAASVAREIVNLGGTVHWNPEVYETILRDMALTRITDVHIENPNFPDEGLLELKKLPQRFGLQVRGPQFTDKSLKYLREIPNLKYLVVSNTSTTDKGLSALKRAMPHLTIMHGYPGDPGYRVVEYVVLDAANWARGQCESPLGGSDC